MEPPREKTEFRIVCAALLLGTFAAYALILRAGFINYDDVDYVTNNQHVQGGLTPGNILWAFATGHAGNWHPLTWISLMLDFQLYGLHAGGFHLTNLLLHTANSLLLFVVLNKMTGALWRSAFVAALFAWHPLHVESVAWIAERKDVLSGLFWMLTLLFYLRYVEAANAKNPAAKKLYGLALLFFACGLLAKPMVVTLPFVLLLMDWWPLKRVGAARLLREKVPFFVLAVISGIVTFAVQRAGGAMAPLKKIPLDGRIANALISYVTYLRKMFWPVDLAVFYPIQPHLPAWQWLGAAILLALVSALAIGLIRKRPYIAVGWFWYLGMLVPVIGLVQVGEQALADRYTYLPLIGIFIVIAWGVADLTREWGAQTVALKVAAAIVLVTCMCLTVVQAGYWKDPITLFTHDLAVARDNAVARANIGDALDKQNKIQEAKAQFMKALELDPESANTLTGLGVLYAHEGDATNATRYFEAALKQRPLYSDAHYNYGNLLAAHGQFADAANHYVLSLREKPDSPDAYNNLGAMYVQLGQLDKAIEEFKIALNLMPDFPEAHAQLAGVLASKGFPDAARIHYAEAVRLRPKSAAYRIRLGMLLGRSGDANAAVAQLQEAVNLEPTNVAAYYNLGTVYTAENRLDAAAECFARAAQLNPGDPNLQGSLAAILAAQGKTEEAARAYREALRLKPDWPFALRDLAWLLATSPKPQVRNGEEAVKLAERANALVTRPDPRILEALDAAYAEAGRFDDAIKTAGKVQQLAIEARQKDLADRAAQRIALYKAGKPFHETAP